MGMDELSEEDKLTVSRARKVQDVYKRQIKDKYHRRYHSQTAVMEAP